MVDLSGIEHKGLFDRAKAIIMTPNGEWPKIEAETKSEGDILKGYVLPLVAIGAIAGLIRSQVFGYGAFGFSYRPGLVSSLVSALLQFVIGVVLVYLLTMIANFLAPKFGGQANRLNAFKMVAYGSTAAWVAGIFSAIPWLGVFALLGFYSIYLYYTAATPMMKVPQDQAAGYTAVTMVCALILFFIAAPITAAVSGLFAFGGMSSVAGSNSGGELTVPGVGKIDTEKLEQIGKQAEAAANGKVPAIDVAKIQALLPASIGAYKRTATESNSLGGVGSEANATYTAGDKSFTLRIADMSALGALAGIGAAMGVSHNKTDANGYEKAGNVNGQMQMEKWSNSQQNGKFAVIVENRFMIEADGSAANIDELKAAVASIDQGGLMSLAD
jgi:hypothetical protein